MLHYSSSKGVMMTDQQAGCMGPILIFVGVTILCLAWIVLPGLGIQGVFSPHPDFGLVLTQTYGSFVSGMFIIFGLMLTFG